MPSFEDIDYTSLKDTFNGMVDLGGELWQCLIYNAQQLLEHLRTFHSWDDVASCMAERPVLAAFVIAVTLSCGIPILAFILFACVTTLLTFTGFLVIEGTILTIASVFLCSFVLGIVVLMMSVAGVAALVYFAFTEMFGSMLRNRETNIVISHPPDVQDQRMNWRLTTHAPDNHDE